jgi:archaeosine-15-forming tRNA-guanine transglycosylase
MQNLEVMVVDAERNLLAVRGQFRRERRHRTYLSQRGSAVSSRRGVIRHASPSDR